MLEKREPLQHEHEQEYRHRIKTEILNLHHFTLALSTESNLYV